MFRIEVNDLQAISHAVLQWEDNENVQFTGNNSNGKSVIGKVIEALTSGNIKVKNVRLSLIRDNTEAGSMLIQHNKVQLAVFIKEELRDSLIMYIPDATNPNKCLIRHLNEGGINEILHKFGFRVYGNGDVCLQLAPTFGSIPFVTTSGSTNDLIVKDITADRIADEFLNAYSSITYPIIRSKVKALKTEIDNNETVLNSMVSYDYNEYGRIAEEAKKVYNIIKNYVFYDFERVVVPPSINVEPLPDPHFRNIKIFVPPPIFDFQNIGKELSDYIDLLNGTCPTCGRPFV